MGFKEHKVICFYYISVFWCIIYRFIFALPWRSTNTTYYLPLWHYFITPEAYLVAEKCLEIAAVTCWCPWTDPRCWDQRITFLLLLWAEGQFWKPSSSYYLWLKVSLDCEEDVMHKPPSGMCHIKINESFHFMGKSH